MSAPTAMRACCRFTDWRTRYAPTKRVVLGGKPSRCLRLLVLLFFFSLVLFLSGRFTALQLSTSGGTCWLFM